MNIKKYKWVIITLLMVISIMVMIFLFSNQTRTASDGVSGKITNVVMKVYKWWYEHTPHDGSGGEVISSGYSLYEDLNHYVRKLAHMTEYAMLGGALLLHIWSISCVKNMQVVNITHIDNGSAWVDMPSSGIIPIFRAVNIIYSSVISILYACTDEFHQKFIAGRGPQFKDVVIDAIGAFLGATLVYIISKAILKKSSKKQTNPIKIE